MIITEMGKVERLKTSPPISPSPLPLAGFST